MQISIKTVPRTPQVNPLDRWAVANETSLSNWQDDPVYSGWANMPMTNKMCDRGDTNSRGRNIPVSNSLWDFVYKINDAAGIANAESVGRQICNRKWKDRWGKIRLPIDGTDDPTNPPDPYMMAEPVIFPVNPVKIIDETLTHYRIDAYVHDDTDWKHLDPKIHNWETEPWKIIKLCAENRNRKIQNVMSGIDVFWPQLCQRTGAWIPKDELVLAPDPSQYEINGKRGIGYRVRGANWYMGLTDGSQVLVRQVTKAAGVKEFHGWRLGARSVVPPAWFQ